MASGAKDWGFDSLQGRQMGKAKREYSAGGAVFKRKNNNLFWLIIQPSAKDQPLRQGRWQLPKGWIDKNETSQEAAVREVKEESGVEAEIVEKIDRINIFFYNEEKQQVVKNIVFFLMEYQSGSIKDHEPETEKAVWLPFKKAYDQMTFKSEKKVLEKAKKILEERKGLF